VGLCDDPRWECEDEDEEEEEKLNGLVSVGKKLDDAEFESVDELCPVEAEPVLGHDGPAVAGEACALDPDTKTEAVEMDGRSLDSHEDDIDLG
jgi:hypothetical protein